MNAKVTKESEGRKEDRGFFLQESKELKELKNLKVFMCAAHYFVKRVRTRLRVQPSFRTGVLACYVP